MTSIPVGAAMMSQLAKGWRWSSVSILQVISGALEDEAAPAVETPPRQRFAARRFLDRRWAAC
jgi:hypothetical protein